MHQQKGITPIIAILVILLITIAITGSAWIYISTYYSGIIGTDTVSSNNIAITREVVAGDCVNSTGDIQASMAASWSATQTGPGEILTFTDTNCARSVNASTARYTVIASGRVNKVQLNC
jgi:flagellin-like protein